MLEHLFVGAVMRHLWLDGFARLEMLKPQVDNSGYDLVLESNSITRHVQLKASHHGAATPKVNIHSSLAKKVSGCIIWIYFDPASLALGPFLWFGGEPGSELPDISSFKIATHTKRNALGVKTLRPNIYTIPKARFERIETLPELVDRLFGPSQAASDDPVASTTEM